jgi:CDP-diacylglycerol---serine O-phosphatidyltransferase
VYFSRLLFLFSKRLFFDKISAMRNHLPNLVTLANLFFGALAAVAVLNGAYELALWLLLLALVADYLDGALARALKVASPLGKELDSLADAVSFGFVPGAIFYQMLSINAPCSEAGICWTAAPGFFVSAAAALRLGRFNLDTRQTDSFIGLPTPAMTMLAMGLLMAHVNNTFGLQGLLEKTAFLYAAVVFLCFLLNAPLPMFSLKFKSPAWKGNEIKFIFVAASAALLAWLQAPGLAAVVLLYILLSLILRFVRKTN